MHLTQEDRDELLLALVKGMGPTLSHCASSGDIWLTTESRKSLDQLEMILKRVTNRDGLVKPTTPTNGNT